MASLHFTFSLALPRSNSCSPIFAGCSILQLKDLRLKKWNTRAVSKKNPSQLGTQGPPSETSDEKAAKNTRLAARRGRKKVSGEKIEEDTVATITNAESTSSASTEKSKIVKKRGRKKAAPVPILEEETVEKKVTKRRTRKKIYTSKGPSITEELGNPEEPKSPNTKKNGEEIHFKEDEEDISYTYSWPPLVCCFGAAQHGFIPSGRPANRLIDHEIHELKKDMFWSPTKFIRAPGSSASSVALALASLGGRVEFMGKLGDDEFGQQMLYHLNLNKVQTRSVKIDSSKSTAISHMKITRRGGIKANCIKPCAEDSLLISEINTDVLKEAKMFYFNSSSLLDQNMRSTAMQAINISRKLGAVIFFDLNLPLPLWKSNEETKSFIQQAWNCANIIEVTKQELEFLCGIEPSEKFDTKDNDKSKYINHQPELIMQLWHEDLKVLFVTNGTSKIHYYTANESGWVHGMEDAPITPFTSDMSVSGDAMVAALMRMITVQPHLATDKNYLEHMAKYAINCGVIDQWMLARVLGFPPKEGVEVSASDLGTVSSITEREYRTVGEFVV